MEVRPSLHIPHILQHRTHVQINALNCSSNQMSAKPKHRSAYQPPSTLQETWEHTSGRSKMTYIIGCDLPERGEDRKRVLESVYEQYEHLKRKMQAYRKREEKENLQRNRMENEQRSRKESVERMKKNNSNGLHLMPQKKSLLPSLRRNKQNL